MGLLISGALSPEMRNDQERNTAIPGYAHGQPAVARSPVPLEELHQIEMSTGWSDEDARVLRRHGEIFRGQAEHMVDAWRAVIGAQPHQAQWFFRSDGKPDDNYKAG